MTVKAKKPAPDRSRKGKVNPQETSESYKVATAAFRENVKALRAQLNWSQRRLAEEANVSQPWINWMENHDESVGFPQMCHIADVFGVPITSMITPGSYKAIAARREKDAVQR